MIIFYDFDGTLTPHSMPQYPILHSCGYTDDVLNPRVKSEIDKGISFYKAYYKCYEEIFDENNLKMNRSNICFGAENTEFNNGVIDYFREFQNSSTGIKHYIVTSGLKYYVEETPLNQYVDGVFGVTYKEENGIYQNLDQLLTDVQKIDVIKQIQKENNNTNEIIYFGDGMTDKLAFEYVHNIGGKTVFIASDERSKENYKELKDTGIITKCFNSNFGQSSEIREFVQSLINNK